MIPTGYLLAPGRGTHDPPTSIRSGARVPAAVIRPRYPCVHRRTFHGSASVPGASCRAGAGPTRLPEVGSLSRRVANRRLLAGGTGPSWFRRHPGGRAGAGRGALLWRGPKVGPLGPPPPPPV